MVSSIETAQLTSCGIRKIRLKGELGKRFGKVHKLAVKTPAEAIRALCVLKKGFKEFLLNSEKHGIAYRFLVQKQELSEKEPKEFYLQHGKQTEFHLIPVIRGAKNSGLFSIIMGVALVGLAFVNPAVLGLSTISSGIFAGFATMPLLMGGAFILTGVSQLLTPTPKAQSPQEKPENKPSYIFNGAVNTIQQGQPIPLLYGELIVGSAVVSAGLTDKDIPSNGEPKEQQLKKGK